MPARCSNRNILSEAPGHSRPVLGRRRALHPVSARPAAARGALGPDRLSVAEVHRPQHHGADPRWWALSRQTRRPVLARPHARLSQPDASPRSTASTADGDAGGLAREQPRHPAEQHRLHGRLPGQGRDLLATCRPSPRSRARISKKDRRVGGADPGRALDGA